MSYRMSPIAVVVVTLTVWVVATIGVAAGRGALPPIPVAEGAPTSAPIKGELTDAQLNDLLSGKTPWAALRVGCDDAVFYGRGIGLIQGEHAQITLDPGELKTLVKELIDARFTAMPASVGGGRLPGRGVPLRLLFTVSVAVGDSSKEVAQLAGGEQSAELAVLRKKITELVSSHMDKAIRAKDFADVLQKMAAGQIAAEALAASINTYPRTAVQGARAVYVRVADGAITSGQGPVNPARKPLAPEEFAKVVKSLAELLLANQVADLPVNVRFTDRGSVVDLNVTALGFAKSVSTAEGTKLGTPETEARFGRIYKGICDLTPAP